MRRIRLILVLAVGFVLGGHAPGAWACSCVSQTEAEHFAAADVVFSGIVTAKDDPEGSQQVVSSGRTIHWTFDVSSVEKGRASDPQVVDSAASGASCGFQFTIGRRYQVFGDADDGRVRTGLCSGTHDLGAGELPTTARGSPIPFAVALLLVSAGLLFRRLGTAAPHAGAIR